MTAEHDKLIERLVKLKGEAQDKPIFSDEELSSRLALMLEGDHKNSSLPASPLKYDVEYPNNLHIEPEDEDLLKELEEPGIIDAIIGEISCDVALSVPTTPLKSIEDPIICIQSPTYVGKSTNNEDRF